MGKTESIKLQHIQKVKVEPRTINCDGGCFCFVFFLCLVLKVIKTNGNNGQTCGNKLYAVINQNYALNCVWGFNSI